MYAEYTVFAVVFSGQQHVCLELLKLIGKPVEDSDDILCFILIFELFRYINKLRKIFRFRSEPLIQAELVLKRLLLLEDFLRVLLIVPEAFFQTFIFKIFYPFSETLRVKDNLPLPLSAP